MEKSANAKQAAAKAVMSIMKLIEKGGDADVTWKLLNEQEERIAKFRQAEHKRVVELRQVMTFEQATAMAMMLVQIVQENCDPHTSQLIGDRINRYLTLGGGESSLASAGVLIGEVVE